jgi:hypothetical protein
MAEDFDDRLRRHEEMIEELRGFTRQLAEMNEQQRRLNEQLARLQRGGDNGRREA